MMSRLKDACRGRECAIPDRILESGVWRLECGQLLWRVCGVWAAAARRRGEHNRAQHSESTEHKSMWTVRDAVDEPRIHATGPNPHTSNYQSWPRCGWSRPSPRDAGTWVGMCAACVC
eukprot:1197298-Prymnesium_polylepis.1